MVDKINFSAIIETGTYRDTTTAYMHQVSGHPVYTVELKPRYYAYSQLRFLFNKNIRVFRGDSRAMLENLSRNTKLSDQKIFFYIDAHCGTELPLISELNIIFQNWSKSVIMIDDFQVPNDEGYGFDDYVPGKVFSLPILKTMDSLDFKVFSRQRNQN